MLSNVLNVTSTPSNLPALHSSMKSFRLFDSGVIRSASSLKAFQESTALYLNQSYLQENHLKPIQYNLIFYRVISKRSNGPTHWSIFPKRRTLGFTICQRKLAAGNSKTQRHSLGQAFEIVVMHDSDFNSE
jgi:hypothetical protein